MPPPKTHQVEGHPVTTDMASCVFLSVLSAMSRSLHVFKEEVHDAACFLWWGEHRAVHHRV